MNAGQKGKLNVFLLGSFKIKYNGQLYDNNYWKSKKALTLFKYLAARCGKKVPRDVLMELLWGDNDVDRVHNLHSTIYFLRKTLKSITDKETCEKLIKYSKGLYWLENCDLCWLDYKKFKKLYKKGKKLIEKEPEKTLELFNEAFSLYRDDFLSGQLYEDWTMNIRQNLREIYIDMILRASALVVDLKSDYTRSVELCQQGLDIDPYREELHQTMLSSLIKDGRYMEAVKKYQDYSKMLYEEFGLYPGSRTRELFEKSNILKNGEFDFLDKVSNNEKETEGPFLCDGTTFKRIFRLGKRRQNRTGNPFSFMIIQQQKKDNSLQKQILEIVHNSLRQGDVVTVWDNERIFIKLFQAGKQAARIIKKRLENLLQERFPSIAIKYYVIEPSEENFSLQKITG